MAAPTVYNNVAEGMELEGQLFAGKSFWVAQRVPSRLRLLDDIKANGGEIVLLEKMADYLIADHFRKGCPPGSISYEFVDKSIKAGEMQDPENHRAGPPLGEAREAGAVDRAVKGSRAAYTAEEDRTLYKWVCDAETAGGLVSGNEIYKKLEAKVRANKAILSSLRLTMNSVRDTPGSHGATDISSTCVAALHQHSTSTIKRLQLLPPINHTSAHILPCQPQSQVNHRHRILSYISPPGERVGKAKLGQRRNTP